MEVIEGKCALMCPQREQEWRKKHGLLHKYERTAYVVKQYGRPAAGRNLLKLEELRPLPVLKKTVQYLLENIMTREDEKWIDIYEFCSDRLRAVCQDMTIQRITQRESAWILESAVRFYLYSDYRLLEETLVQRYDANINTTLLMECLKRVLVNYGDCHNHTDEETHSCAEMAAIYVLFNLDSQEALLYSFNLHKSLRHSPLLSEAIKISISYHLGNYFQVLKSMRSHPPLLMCCLSRHVQSLRRELLLRLCHGFNSKSCRFPLTLLSRWLQLDDIQEVRKLCTLYNISMEKEFVVFQKSAFNYSQNQSSRQHDCYIDQQLQESTIVSLIGGNLTNSSNKGLCNSDAVS